MPPSGKPDPQVLPGSNGDMGENESAAFDPIFYFHHSNIDRLFYIWQMKYNSTEKIKLSTDPTDSGTWGTNQGATPGIPLNQQLNEKSPLYPFVNYPGVAPLTLADVTNLNARGRDYSIGSLDPRGPAHPETLIRLAFPIGPTYLVHNLPKNTWRGSFIVEAWHRDTKELLGFVPVLSRGVAGNCPNCGLHQTIQVVIPLAVPVDKEKIVMKIRTRKAENFNSTLAIPTQTFISLLKV